MPSSIFSDFDKALIKKYGGAESSSSQRPLLIAVGVIAVVGIIGGIVIYVRKSKKSSES